MNVNNDLPNEVPEGEEKRKRHRKRKNAPVVEECAVAIDNTAGTESEYTNDNTVYIEGLPFGALEEDITNFFKPVGKTRHDSGRLRGYGHVVFANSAIASKAMGLDGSYMLDRYIKVAKSQTPRIVQQALTRQRLGEKATAPAGCRCVFVKNIPYDTTEDDLRDALQVCGPVSQVRLAVWGHTQQLKGFAYVDFKREDSATIAVNKSGVLAVKSRPVLIDFETGVPKGSFKAPKST